MSNAAEMVIDNAPPTVPQGELVVINPMNGAPLTAAVVFGPGGVETILSRLETEVRAIKTDVTTPKGRDAIKSLAFKVTKSKTALDGLGKDLTADLKKQTGAIDAERRMIRERLDALADEVRKPLTDFEDAEKARVAAHEDALAAITAMAVFVSPEPTAKEIRGRIALLEDQPDRNWQEFAARAAEVTDHVTLKLRDMAATATKREADAAEAERLRLEREAQERRDNEARIAQQAADAARAEAEAMAAAEAARVAAAAEEERQAAERERQRIAQQAADEKAAREKAEREATEAVAAREKAEADAKAAAEKAEADRIAAAEKAEADRIAAEAKADADRIAAAEKAESDRLAAAEAAAAAERQRQTDAKAAEEAAAAAREANKQHRSKINNEIKAALVEAGISDDQAVAVITAIVKGQVPHTKISY